MTHAQMDQDIDLALDNPPTRRYIHTHMPSPMSLLANGAWAAMALLASAILAGAYTGRIDIESPVVPVLLIVMYALATLAVHFRRRADQHLTSNNQEV